MGISLQLVVIDGSKNSERALEHAIYLAELVQAKIGMLHVVNLNKKMSSRSLKQAKYREKDMGSMVELSAQQAYLNLTKAESIIETNKVAVEKATEDIALAQARYSVNLGTNLDVVDAQVALTATKMTYIQSLYDYNVSKAALDKAIGKVIN